MGFLILKRCCFCNDVRTGSFIIAYLLLIERVIKVAMASVRLSGVDIELVKYHNMGVFHDLLGFSRMILCFGILLSAFEILMCIVLLYGLYKKHQDHIQMFYVCDLFFFGLRMILVVAMLMHLGRLMLKKATAIHWVIFATECLWTLVYFYFLVVIRSYAHQLQAKDIKEDKNKFFTKSLKV